MSQDRKCVSDEDAVISLDDIQVDETLNYVEKPIAVPDRTLLNKEVKLVKVKWQHRKGSEWAWEMDDEMRKHYPNLFTLEDFEDEV